MTAIRTNIALTAIRAAHNVVQTEDRRAVLLALNAANRAGNKHVCFFRVAEVALRKSMNIHPDAFLNRTQLELVKAMAAPFINNRLLSIARTVAVRSANARSSVQH